MVPLLSGDDIPETARRALIDHRPREAGKALMKAFELSCDEAKQLVADPCVGTNSSSN
jgi:hypothetical protein